MRIEALEAEHDGRGTARERADVHHQNHRCPEPLGDLRRGAILAEAIAAVETTHDALDQGKVGPRSALADGGHDLLAATHPAVEIVRRSACRQRVVGRVDEVGPHLEGLHAEPTATERLEEPQSHRGFPDAARHSGDDDDGHRLRDAHRGRYTAGTRDRVAGERHGGLDSGVIV